MKFRNVVGKSNIMLSIGDDSTVPFVSLDFMSQRNNKIIEGLRNKQLISNMFAY